MMRATSFRGGLSFMNSLRRCSILVVFAAALAAVGCKKDEPTPTPEPTSSAPAPIRGKGPIRPPMGPLARVDPQVMKEYRADVCYFGTLTLKQARDAYVASMGKDEPSEKKMPSF